jgi:Cu/Zn superoxide dismutase
LEKNSISQSLTLWKKIPFQNLYKTSFVFEKKQRKMFFNLFSLVLVLTVSVKSAPVPLAPLDCFGDLEPAPVRAARLTNWVATTAASKTAETIALVAQTLAAANARFANGETDAAGRELERILAVSVAADAAALAVAAAAYGARMVAGLELVLVEVCPNLETQVLENYASGIDGVVVVSLDYSQALHFRFYLRNVQKGLHSFHLHNSSCDPLLYNSNFDHQFPELDANYKHNIHQEFSTHVTELSFTNSLSLHDRLEVSDPMSLIIHAHGQEFCAELSLKYGAGPMRKYDFSFGVGLDIEQ